MGVRIDKISENPLVDLSNPKLRFQTPHGIVTVVSRAELQGLAAWQNAFAHLRKDYRYYEIVEDTLKQDFEHGSLLLQDSTGSVRAVQPFFVLSQDLLAGAGSAVGKLAAAIRKIFPRFLTLRTLMVGCAAGEGHLDADLRADDQQAVWIAQCLHAMLKPFAASVRASLIVLKEFPGSYRSALAPLALDGFTRIPSLPMTRLNIDFADFEQYMTKTLSKVMRKNLRRKFRDAEAATQRAPITLEVVADVTPHVDEVYPLYLAVYERSSLHFEKLTVEYLCRVGREMPDKVRFFIWRQNGKAIAFSLCMLQGDSIYDEYLGLDYSVALDLHLYFYTLRDILQWAMKNGYKWYCSSALNYDPKLHLRCELVPLDLYVRHTGSIANAVMRRILPWLAPTRGDKVLPQFANYDVLWGKP